MNKKNQADAKGLVYSTDPNFRQDVPHEEVETLPPAKQKLRIHLETKHRGGKTVTVVNGFVGKNDDLEDLGKKLKTSCGTGGSAKDGEIIIQGDHREKIKAWLQKNDYPVK
jgi:translation initiation factor 1